MKKTLSGTDISMIVKELQPYVGTWIDNVFEINDLYILKLRGSKKGTILIEPSKRIHITEYEHQTLDKPSDNIISLRKHIHDGNITKISQYGTDRIVTIDIEAREKKFQLICEFFANGNAILVEKIQDTLSQEDLQNRKIIVIWYKVTGNRPLILGKEYIYPPIKVLTLDTLIDSNLVKLIKKNASNVAQIIRYLVGTYNIGGEMAEEILHSTQIPRKNKVNQFTVDQWNSIYKSVDEFLKREYNPCIIYCEDLPITVTTKDLISIEGKRVNFKTFNKAVDEYFHYYEEHVMDEDLSRDIRKFHTIINTQSQLIKDLEKIQSRKKRCGTLIYQYYGEIEELFNTIKNARSKNISWEETISKLENAKEKGTRAAQILVNIEPNNKLIEIQLEEETLRLNFTQKITDIANRFYQSAKKEAAKIDQARKIIKEAKINLKNVKSCQRDLINKSKVLLKQREKK